MQHVTRSDGSVVYIGFIDSEDHDDHPRFPTRYGQFTENDSNIYSDQGTGSYQSYRGVGSGSSLKGVGESLHKLYQVPYAGYTDPYQEGGYRELNVSEREKVAFENSLNSKLKTLLLSDIQKRPSGSPRDAVSEGEISGRSEKSEDKKEEEQVVISKALTTETYTMGKLTRSSVNDDMYLVHGLARRCMEQTPAISDVICHYRGLRHCPATSRPVLSILGHMREARSLGLFDPIGWCREETEDAETSALLYGTAKSPPNRQLEKKGVIQVVRAAFRFCDIKKTGNSPGFKDISSVKKPYMNDCVVDNARVNVVLVPATVEDRTKLKGIASVKHTEALGGILFIYYSFFISFYGS